MVGDISRRWDGIPDAKSWANGKCLGGSEITFTHPSGTESSLGRRV